MNIVHVDGTKLAVRLANVAG